MTPVQEDHLAKALALVISQYAGKPVLQGVITSYMNRMNAIEAAIYAIFAAFDISTTPPVGFALDTLASVVGENRNGQTDAQLWATMQARVIANKSRGDANEIIAAANEFGVTSYTEGPGVWQVTYSSVPATPENVFRILNLARAASYRGLVAYPSASSAIAAIWQDAASTIGNASNPFGDAASGTPGNAWFSLQQVG